jgi:hypothetical protein
MKAEGARSGRQYFHYTDNNGIFLPQPVAESSSWLNSNKSGMIYDVYVEHPLKRPVNGADDGMEVSAVDGVCFTTDGKEGRCMSFQKCNPLLHLNEMAERERNKDADDDGFDSHKNLREEMYQLLRNKNCSAVTHAGMKRTVGI